MEIKLKDLSLAVFSFRSWQALMLVMGLVLLLPLAWVVTALLKPFDAIWIHLLEFVIPETLSNTIILMLGVGVGVLLLGIPTAALIAHCEFPGKNFFQWALVLPMALPAYIMAYTYTSTFDNSALLAQWINDWHITLPDIHSMPFAIILLSLALYPYVYLLTRNALIAQSGRFTECARSLGLNRWESFCAVSLPLARPAIFSGLLLAMMETLADYGTVKYFGINTFTTTIFRTWFGLDALATATQLSAFLLLIVFVLISVEQHFRGQMQTFQNAKMKAIYTPSISLKGWPRYLATFFCTLLFFFGFFLPVSQLIYNSFLQGQAGLSLPLFTLSINSLSLATLSALLIVFVSLGFIALSRFQSNRFHQLVVHCISFGYALPSTVIALGVMGIMAMVDQTIYTSFGFIVLSGSWFAILYAYFVRFSSVALQSLSSGLKKISPAMDEAGYSLGESAHWLFWRLHIPMLKRPIFAAFLLVWIDILKELPATMVLRPFNFNTLAVSAFEMASDERLIEAALPSLLLVILGLIPVILLNQIPDEKRTQ